MRLVAVLGRISSCQQITDNEETDLQSTVTRHEREIAKPLDHTFPSGYSPSMAADTTQRQLYYRHESPTQSKEVARLQVQSGEVWGRAPQQSDLPAVQAYIGQLPPGVRGVEFYTDTVPDTGGSPRIAYWRGPRPGVRVEMTLLKLR